MSEYHPAQEEAERLREALKQIVDHDPRTPGLQYESIGQLLQSVLGIARQALGE